MKFTHSLRHCANTRRRSAFSLSASSLSHSDFTSLQAGGPPANFSARKEKRKTTTEVHHFARLRREFDTSSSSNPLSSSLPTACDCAVTKTAIRTINRLVEPLDCSMSPSARIFFATPRAVRRLSIVRQFVVDKCFSVVAASRRMASTAETARETETNRNDVQFNEKIVCRHISGSDVFFYSLSRSVFIFIRPFF